MVGIWMSPQRFSDPGKLSDIEHITGPPPEPSYQTYLPYRVIGLNQLLARRASYRTKSFSCFVLASAQNVSYYISGSPNRTDTMKTIVGLTLAAVIGSCVVALIMDLYATIQTSLQAAGL